MSDEALPEPERDEVTGVPFCSETCRYYDGKRCELLGLSPGNICEPAVALLTAENARLREELAHAREAERERCADMLDKKDDSACLDCGCYSLAADLIRELKDEP